VGATGVFTADSGHFVVGGGNNQNLAGPTGNDTIWGSGNGDTIAGGPGSELKGVVGDNDEVDGTTGNDTIWASGNEETVNAGTGTDLIGASGNGNLINAGAGSDTIYSSGSGDTVSGNGNALIEEGGGSFTFLDTSNVYNDTIVGFDQAAGDRIDLVGGHGESAQSVNGGQDTLITLSDHSTILLKGITNLNSSFFS
jgi:Ca2+-binding RTX toxin-like protein